jgi:hypothetical protein
METEIDMDATVFSPSDDKCKANEKLERPSVIPEFTLLGYLVEHPDVFAEVHNDMQTEYFDPEYRPVWDYIEKRMAGNAAMPEFQDIRSDTGLDLSGWSIWHELSVYYNDGHRWNAYTIRDWCEFYKTRHEPHEPQRPEDSADDWFSTRAQDRDAPPPIWLVPELLEEGTDAAIYAPLSFLKSFAALDIGFAIATGTRALGVLPVSEAGLVVYYCGEGYNDVRKKRAPAWEIAHGLEPYSVDSIIFARQTPYVTDRAAIEKALDILDCKYLQGRRVKLSIIDTLNRSLNGMNEDAASTASTFLNTAKWVRERVGGTTLTVAHMGYAMEHGRGSTAFEAGFDTVLYITEHHKNEDDGIHTICILVKKQKAGDDGAKFWLQSKLVTTDIGTSLALVPVSEEIGQAALQAKQTGRITPDIVDTAMIGNGGHISTAALAKTIGQRTGKPTDTVRKFLDRSKTKPEFAKFVIETASGTRWALPELIAAEAWQPAWSDTPDMSEAPSSDSAEILFGQQKLARTFARTSESGGAPEGCDEVGRGVDIRAEGGGIAGSDMSGTT